jgi:hypothetical protein
MDIALAVELDSGAILPIHIPDAVAVGVRLEAIEAIVARRYDELEPEERQLVDYAHRYARGAVDDDAYAGMRERFGDRGAVEFNVLLGFLVMTIRLWAALGLPEPTDAEIAAQIDDIRSGRIELPDPNARIG